MSWELEIKFIYIDIYIYIYIYIYTQKPKAIEGSKVSVSVNWRVKHDSIK